MEQVAHNAEDHFAVAVVKDETIIDHVPCEALRLVWHFIEHDETVTCEVTGHRKHGIGLEVPYLRLYFLLQPLVMFSFHSKLLL